MGLDGAGAEIRLDFAVSDVNGQNAQALLEELNETLISILGHNGTAHVCMDDFSRDGGFFLVGYATEAYPSDVPASGCFPAGPARSSACLHAEIIKATGPP